MNTRRPFSPEVRALLDRERVIPPVSAAQRARAMARARASLAAPVATTTPPVATARPRWVAAAAAAVVLSAAVGAAAYEIRRARSMPAPTSLPAAPAAPREIVAKIPASPAPAEALGDLTPPSVEESGLSPAQAERAELRLLRQARAEVERGAFEAALAPIAEHTRRFRNGRLAEEREALRVKALAGLGRNEEARRAAAAFRARFPRSVLLPAVSRMPFSGP